MTQKYQTIRPRCNQHHYLPGKEYTFMILKPLGEEAYGGNIKPLLKELKLLKDNIQRSKLDHHFTRKNVEAANPARIISMEK